MSPTIAVLPSSVQFSGIINTYKSYPTIKKEIINEMTLRCGKYFEQADAQVKILQQCDTRKNLSLFLGPIMFMNGSVENRDSEKIWIEVSKNAEVVVFEDINYLFPYDSRFIEKFIKHIEAFAKCLEIG
jgi:hypothetical protein